MTTLRISAAVLLLATAAFAQLGGGSGGGSVGEQQGYGHGGYYHTPHYNYEYGVNDEKTGDHKRHKETREGDNTHGEYSFTESDGTVRTVKYQVQGKSGFVATVSHSGHSKHPARYTQYFNTPGEKQEEPARPVYQNNDAPLAVAPAPAHFTQALYGAPQQQQNGPQQFYPQQQQYAPQQQQKQQYAPQQQQQQQYAPQQQQQVPQQQYVPEAAAPAAPANTGNRESYGTPLRYLPPPAAPAPAHGSGQQQGLNGAQQQGQNNAFQGFENYKFGDAKEADEGLLSLSSPAIAALFSSYGQAGVGFGKELGAQGGLSGAQGGLYGAQGGLSGAQGGLSGAQGGLYGAQGGLYQGLSSYDTPLAGFGSGAYQVSEGGANGANNIKDSTPVRAPASQQNAFEGYGNGQQGGYKLAQGAQGESAQGGLEGLTLATYGGNAQRGSGKGASAIPSADFGNIKGGFEGYAGNFEGVEYSQSDFAKALAAFDNYKGADQYSFDDVKGGYEGYGKSLNGFQPILNGNKGREQDSFEGLEEYSKGSFAGVQADAAKGETASHSSSLLKGKRGPIVKTVRYIPATTKVLRPVRIIHH